MALQYGPHPRPHNYNSSDGESEAEPRPTFESCQKEFNKACSVGDLEAVKRYLSHGASVDGMRGCFTPLYHALSGKFGDKSPSFEVARYLIEHGADVNLERSSDGTSWEKIGQQSSRSSRLRRPRAYA